MIRVLIACALLATAAPVAAQTIAITGGTVALGDGSEPITGGTVVIRNGRIVAAGANVRIPPGAEVVDARGKWVTPGIVAGFSRLGLSEVDLSGPLTDDKAQNGPFGAAIDVAPGINPSDTAISVNRADGVTRAIVAPNVARSIFAGQGAVIDLGADMEPITRARAFQFVELGETGGNTAGGSRPSAYIQFRNALREARELGRYSGSIASSGRAVENQADQPIVRNPNESRLYGPDARRSDDVLLTRYDAVALVPVLQGRQALLVHVERARDILNVLSLKRDYPALKIVLVGATEGWLVADKIAAANVPVIASAVNDLPANFEQIAATQSNVGRMRNAGVRVAIGMIDDNDTRYLFNQRQYAGNLVALRDVPGASGVRWGEALAMITSGPAEALGMGRDIGSLTPGRRADVVIWSGDPLQVSSNADAVFIDGVQQPMDTRQTKLRDRYRDLSRDVLPEAYTR
ncbi:amidohydrolase family protein [Sphingomonas daechungensis]|uniref:Amidohydrolase family protein n=1 Tax=Sphingomonas daechungensis TaxID=1176646 RepID=A0ABX6SYX4_9SPHN|nr:amidohydrolase family protein [Sphingomonas daechungensis]QNP42786.1 amidohydrolase family protein [Sphingomonas daechungensis]